MSSIGISAVDVDASSDSELLEVEVTHRHRARHSPQKNGRRKADAKAAVRGGGSRCLPNSTRSSAGLRDKYLSFELGGRDPLLRNDIKYGAVVS